MPHFRKQFLIFVALIGLALGIFTLMSTPGVDISEVRQVQIGDSVFDVEIAMTPEQRQQGLSGHKPLKNDEGMLFVFERPGKYGFWMKDMLFDLDIIWLAPSEVEGILKIIHIEKNLGPETYPKTFSPKESALYVLEINAGLSEKNNFKIGDSVKLN